MDKSDRERRDLGPRFIGRVLRKWRLQVGLSQEELARRAGLSPTFLGVIEREKAHLSVRMVCMICHGLESKTERPMLGVVLADILTAFWDGHVHFDAGLREEKGLAQAEYRTEQVGADVLGAATDELYAVLRRVLLLWYEAFCDRVAERADLAEAPIMGRVRVREAGRKTKP